MVSTDRLFEEVLLCRAGSGQLMFPVLLYFTQNNFLLGHLVRSNDCRSCLRWLLGPFSQWSLDVLRVLAPQFDEREVHPRDNVSFLEIPAQVSKPADLRRHYKRFDLAFQVVALGVPLSVHLSA